MSKQAVIHEYTHSLEGTKQYANFADSLIKQMQNSDPNFTAVATEITNKYFDETKSQETNNYIAQTELVSHYTSQLFTDETIKKIANADKSLATKVWEWIKNKIALLKAKRGGEEKYVTLRFLQRAETLYSQAIKTTRGGVSIGAMDRAIKESKGETVKDVVRDIRFSRQLNDLGLESFDKETLNNIKMRYGVVVDSYKSLEQNIEKAINTDNKVNLYLGTVDNAILSKIEQSVHELLFANGKNYTFVISYDDIRHIKHHFDVNNMATEILKIYEIFKTYDNVKYINDKNNKKLVFEKSFDNADYRTVELVSNKKSSIDLVTLFIKKINNKKDSQFTNAANEQSPSSRPKTHITSTVDTNSISPKPENVNSFDKNKSKNDENIRFSKTLSFDEQVDQTLKGLYPKGNMLKVSDTPKILQGLGLKNLPMLITQKHINKILTEHDLSVEAIKQLPKLLENPVMVLKSFTDVAGSIVVVTEIKDNSDKPVIIAVKIDGSGYYNDIKIDSNVITSAYGRNNFESFINRAINEKAILYLDNKKSQGLLNTVGLQLPKGLINLDSTSSISQKTENVNSFDKNNSKKDENIRFSKELDPANIKAVANVRMDKVYSKKEIGEAVDGILEDVLSNANYQAALSGAKKQSVIDTLFNSFNTATDSKRKAIAKDIAQYLIKETALESIYKADLREQTVEDSARIIDTKGRQTAEYLFLTA